MGAMHDNIPCKVTMELSAFPDDEQPAVTRYKDAANVCKSCLKFGTVGTHMGCAKEHHTVGGELDGPPMNKMISGG
jgi:hypothetical protein